MTSSSIAIDLANLNSQYSALLTQYETAVAEYTALLQSQNTPPLIAIPNKAFWGSGAISSSTVPSAIECRALCSNANGCSGATYSQETKLCSLRSGEGSLVPMPDASNSVALIPEETYLLLNIQSLNSQLLEINSQIMAATQSGQPAFNSEYSQRQEQATDLLDEYQLLTEERDKINNMIQSFEDLNQEEIEGDITISQNYNSFVLLVILVIVSIFLIYILTSQSSSSSALPKTTFQQGGKLGMSAFLIVFIIILISLVVKYFSNIQSFIKSFQ